MPNTPAEARPRFRRWLAFLAAVFLGAAVLIPASPAAAVDDASISGTVTFFPGDAPVLNSSVVIVNEINVILDLTSTNSSGYYEFVGLAAGEYKVCLTSGVAATPVHANVCWDYRPFIGMSDTFTVAESEAAVVDIQVVNGATISGTVAGEFGPSDNWYITLDAFYDDGFGTQVYGSSAYVAIDEFGNWSYPRLQPGTYQVRYFDSGDTDYRFQYHNQTTLAAEADDIVLFNNDSVTLTAYMSELGPLAVSRLWGASRYETAVRVSEQFDPFLGDCNFTVYIAAGGNYPDALAAAALAAKVRSPLLLTQAGALPSVVVDELVRLEPCRIVIAGGTGAVSVAVENQLNALAFSPIVNRLGGANRYETAQMLVEYAFSPGGGAPAEFTTAFIATGRNYADALAAGAAAASHGAPVILVDGSRSSMTTEQVDWLSGAGVTKIYIAGGTGAVSAGIESHLSSVFTDVGAVERLGGVDRYATSVLVNAASLATGQKVYLATGSGFADALAGAALAGARNSLLYSVRTTCIPSLTMDALKSANIDEVVLLGGTGVLTQSVHDLAKC